MGALPLLRDLQLHGNQFGDAGLAALAKAITPVAKGDSGALPALNRIVVTYELGRHPQLVWQLVNRAASRPCDSEQD